MRFSIVLCRLPPVVHVHVRRAAIPAFRRHVRHALESELDPRHVTRDNFDLGFGRPELEAFDGDEAQRTDGHVDIERTGRVEGVIERTLQEP